MPMEGMSTRLGYLEGVTRRKVGKNFVNQVACTRPDGSGPPIAVAHSRDFAACGAAPSMPVYQGIQIGRNGLPGAQWRNHVCS